MLDKPMVHTRSGTKFYIGCILIQLCHDKFRTNFVDKNSYKREFLNNLNIMRQENCVLVLPFNLSSFQRVLWWHFLTPFIQDNCRGCQTRHSLNECDKPLRYWWLIIVGEYTECSRAWKALRSHHDRSENLEFLAGENVLDCLAIETWTVLELVSPKFREKRSKVMSKRVNDALINIRCTKTNVAFPSDHKYVTNSGWNAFLRCHTSINRIRGELDVSAINISWRL